MAVGAQADKPRAVEIRVTGTVQGVGFRPYVFSLASRLGLAGEVWNSSGEVGIFLEGPSSAVESFLAELRDRPPRLARITSLEVRDVEPRQPDGFRIVPSRESGSAAVTIPPDVALCDDCCREVFDSQDRHYQYPFTNCTNCGPRYTIIESSPYDRSRTTMRSFPMCESCEGEYEDPTDRRFHAQPTACPACGPTVWLANRQGKTVTSRNWRQAFQSVIRSGAIVAVKGLGGFHLCCDARNETAVRELRRRKGRPHRPLAVMVRDLEVARKYCSVSDREAALLSSPEAPIVILTRTDDEGLAPALAPGLGTLGVMLPYTPLHTMLFADDIPVLVMTSGNFSGLPLAIDNDEALRTLAPVADYFLLHNREILNRCDDSLVRVVDDEVHLYRRSRGWVPLGIKTALPAGPAVFAVGGDMKNTFCLLKDDTAFMGPHVGDLEHIENEEAFRAAAHRMEVLTSFEAEVVACDLHPRYHSRELALELARKRGAPLVEVQHHHAHMAACMAENDLEGRVVGIICDGTGYGTDGQIWGMEVLVGGYEGFSRASHLRYTPLIGGDVAVREAWRMGLSLLVDAFGYYEGSKLALDIFGRAVPEAKLKAVLNLMRTTNPPRTSSCGRLFDGVSALLGICRESTYEGQPAIELSECAEPAEPYEDGIDQVSTRIDQRPLVRRVIRDLLSGEPPAVIAGRFQATVAAALVSAALEAVERHPETRGRVVLSGGTFQNAWLFKSVRDGLIDAGCQVFYHSKVPTNDGGLALGQAAVGRVKGR